MATDSPTAASAGPDPAGQARNRPAPRSWGWTTPGGGRAATVQAGVGYQGTTSQVCGLYPYAVSSGAAPRGVPIGRHMHTAEPVGLDPSEWLHQGLVTNTGLWVQGQPGVGKSTIIKRLMTGLTSFGFLGVVPGDVKGEYSPLVESLGGTVWRVGRGLARLNPLDIGPLRQAVAAATGQARAQLLETVRARQLSLLEALITIVRRQQSHPEITTTERRLLGRALDLATTADPTGEPVIPDLLRILEQAPEAVQQLTASADERQFRRDARELINSLGVLCEGAIRGMFDQRSTVAAPLDTPAMSLDISALHRDDDEVVAAAMLSSWAWSAAAIDATQAVGQRRNVFRPMDELWRALRVAPGLVEYADRLTRLNRHEGEVTAQSTHSFDDLEALPNPADVAKARGMAARNGVLVLGGLDNKEIEAISRIAPLTSGETSLLTSWAAPPTWVAGMSHPGRGKYLIKSGERLGLPVAMSLTATERSLYDTDTAWHTNTAWPDQDPQSPQQGVAA
ncbi:hypothetical protein FHX42_005196 [Saccharopolyspora lacisalsi]|uniref:ATP-binding protein n=1 Tax=Halosaccharopolyspora lacisalsi TaxID=1000566 RepID=A0A839E4L0_9PSEU|nr:ATP-binding protein [Halosaccharopolyspora lacisalsi]MBA8827789.1 hypothetical protein [Halosaccharopolyspora lacisalsi]